jgi:hypothetical protein
MDSLEFISQFNEGIAALIELESMKAANQLRTIHGHAPLYLESDFIKLQEKYNLGYNQIIEKNLKLK